ncbi:hypothetical protein ES707_18023 [subsurface metagenome]
MESANKPKKFRDCFECDGKYCNFFGAPAKYSDIIHTAGVLIDLYRDEFALNSGRYFEIHEGITISEDGKRFIIGKNIDVRIMDTRLGRQLIVYSKCTKLDEKDRCTIYNERPDMCRNFNEKTAKYYHIPSGCKYDPGGCGEDFGV